METKKELKFFSINQHKDEEAYLRRMHQEGWKFVKVDWLGLYHFVKCEPEDVIYQLDYNKEGIANKSEYIRMFADCGWECVADYAGFFYFRKRVADMQGDESIFSDSASRVALMERTLKRSLTPLLMIFSCTLMPQFALQLSWGNYGVAGFLGGCLLAYLIVFVTAFVTYYRYKRKVEG